MDDNSIRQDGLAVMELVGTGKFLWGEETFEAILVPRGGGGDPHIPNGSRALFLTGSSLRQC